MRVSVIIPTYKRVQYLQDAVTSIVAQDLPQSKYEILVVDNAPQPTPELVSLCDSLQSPLVRYVHEPRNGLHHARHTGAKRARGDILVYVDDDIRATPEWLAALCRPFAETQVGVVGGRIYPEWDVEPQEWIRAFPPGYLSLLDLGDSHLELTWPQQVYGCNFAVRKSVLFEVRGFNPDSFADPGMRWYRGDGETGLLKKVYAAGYSVRYEPTACVYHRIPADRLTIAYFERRAFDHGLSDAFGAWRARRFSRLAQNTSGRRWCPQMKKRLSRLGRVAWEGLLGDEESCLLMRIWSFYLKARGEHMLRFLLSSKLRCHVLQDNYWA